MSLIRPARLSRLALASLILGVLSFVLSLAGSVPAFLLGLYGLRAINGDPNLRGRRLAIAGMSLGSLSGLLTCVGLAALLLIQVNLLNWRSGCTDNLRSLGLAVNVYHDSHGDHYPAAVVRAPALPPERRLSWGVEVLSCLEQGTAAGKKWLDLAEKLDPTQPWDAPANRPGLLLRSPRWLCPAWRPPEPRATEGWTTYVGLAGVGTDAPRLPLANSRAGFFGYERTPSRTDVRAGISATMMITETTQELGPWIAGGTPTLRSLKAGAAGYFGPGESFGGLHPDGLNVLWVDGSVRFLPPNTDPALVRKQATLSGRPEE